MTAREVWKHWYRALRVVRREQRKAEHDAMLYGTGIMIVPSEGDPHHVKLEDFYAESSADA